MPTRPLLADLQARDYNPMATGVWTRGLLIRRRLVDGELAYFTTWAPQGTSLETLAWVEGHRWSIEQAFETAKGELGLNHNEIRSWHGWHRHISLVMLAFTLLARVRHQANNTLAPSKTIGRLMTLTYPN
ncbi:SRSO17 transposase [Azomonas macrocytogenes]|uniref:SRSO17 transposase n=1 Tax=Azomonas macrocytogenes TaxID=69962 RepID=A0A839T7R6_AZOMA|nr:SRSO17 transposase [Azomonas macrocytogenes]